MKFTLDGAGVDHINQGIGSVFRALASAPMVRQQAEEQAALRNAQAYNANMSGNKLGAQAESERYTLDRRRSVPELIAADPDMPAHIRAAYKVFDLTGDTNMERIANAGQTFQTMDYRTKAADNLRDPNEMNKYISIAAGKTYEPFAPVGTTGYSINQATGDQTEENQVLANLFGRKTNSEISRNDAQAYNWNMSGKQHAATTDKIRAEPKAAAKSRQDLPATSTVKKDSKFVNLSLQKAREAIASGAPREAVIQRLKDNGIDPTGL